MPISIIEQMTIQTAAYLGLPTPTVPSLKSYKTQDMTSLTPRQAGTRIRNHLLTMSASPSTGISSIK